MNAVPKLLVLTTATALLMGCSLIPEYNRPVNSVPQAFPNVNGALDGAKAGNADIADLPWQSYFADPKLQALIKIALKNNRDLRVAALNIESARAQYQISKSNLFPAISATGTGTNERVVSSLSTTGKEYISHSYSASVGFSSYELDFFGRLRSLKEQALETYFSKEETRRSTQISLVAEVVSGYLTLLADQERLQLAQNTLKSQEDTLGLTTKQYAVGAASEQDLSSAQASRHSAKVDVETYITQVAQDKNALVLLLGAPIPDETLAGASLEVQGGLAELPVGLSSDVLLRRPDVLAAEHTLKGDNANIGAARAKFFPSITLTGSAGAASGDLGSLFKAGAGTWSFSPSINLPIFNAGNLQANLDVAKVTRDIDVATYEKTVQTAFKEVADALAQKSTIANQLEAQEALVKAYQRYYDLSLARYKAGIDSGLTLMIAQRSLFSSQQSLISTRLTRASNLVTLYKVLGGGWQEDDTSVKTAEK